MSRSANLSLCRSVALSPLRIVKVSNRAQLRRRYANKNQITQGQKTSSPNGRMMPTHLTNQGINQPDVDETGYYEFPPIGPCVREARAGLPVLGVLRFPQRGTKSALLYIVHNLVHGLLPFVVHMRWYRGSMGGSVSLGCVPGSLHFYNSGEPSVPWCRCSLERSTSCCCLSASRICYVLYTVSRPIS